MTAKKTYAILAVQQLWEINVISKFIDIETKEEIPVGKLLDGNYFYLPHCIEYSETDLSFGRALYAYHVKKLDAVNAHGKIVNCIDIGKDMLLLVSPADFKKWLWFS